VVRQTLACTRNRRSTLGSSIAKCSTSYLPMEARCSVDWREGHEPVEVMQAFLALNWKVGFEGTKCRHYTRHLLGRHATSGRLCGQSYRSAGVRWHKSAGPGVGVQTTYVHRFVPVWTLTTTGACSFMGPSIQNASHVAPRMSSYAELGRSTS
jgi:hypothetical protein